MEQSAHWDVQQKCHYQGTNKYLLQNVPISVLGSFPNCIYEVKCIWTVDKIAKSSYGWFLNFIWLFFGLSCNCWCAGRTEKAFLVVVKHLCHPDFIPAFGASRGVFQCLSSVASLIWVSVLWWNFCSSLCPSPFPESPPSASNRANPLAPMSLFPPLAWEPVPHCSVVLFLSNYSALKRQEMLIIPYL